MKGAVVDAAGIKFTQAQLDALSELAAELRPEERLYVMQTWTQPGNTHLYATTPDQRRSGMCSHVALSGNVTDCQVTSDHPVHYVGP